MFLDEEMIYMYILHVSSRPMMDLYMRGLFWTTICSKAMQKEIEGMFDNRLFILDSYQNLCEFWMNIHA